MPKPCRVEGCLLPKALPAQSCYFHDLMRQPIDRQVSQAMTREAMVPKDCRLPRVSRWMWAPGTRWCGGCQSMPPLFYFSPQAAQCRACSSAARHAASIRKEYDLEPEEYAALLEVQDGRCAICRQRPVSIRLAVDHDHRTGKVLGLLCSRCNHDLKGSAWDSLDLARALVGYMEHPPMSGEWRPYAPKKAARAAGTGSPVTPSDVAEFGSEAAARGLPEVLQTAARRMSVDDLVLSGGKSDPDTGVYWLAYRRSNNDQPPF